MTSRRRDRDYFDVLISIGAASNGHYSVDVQLGDGGRFTGGQLALDQVGLNLAALTFDDKEHGKKLHEALFASSKIRDAYQEAVGVVRPHQSQWRGLRVRLAIDAGAPALHALGWERIYHEKEGEWGPLATSSRTPFSRYVALTSPHPEPARRRPVRLFIAVSNPAGVEDVFAPIDVDKEIENLCGALAEIDQSLLDRVTVMPGRTGLSAKRRAALEGAGVEIVDGPTSRESIIARLQRGYDVFHFLGHGSYDQGTAQTTLHLEDAAGGWARVTDADVSGRMQDLDEPPRLVFLAACQSATRSEQDAFVGLAPKLVRANVPAVVAMQDCVRMDHARTLARYFYENLFTHGIVDLALNQARSLLYKPGSLDWGIPVLFTRLEDGRLFAAAENAETKTAAPIATKPRTVAPAASKPSRAPTPCIRWLHLSDLHAGAEGEPLLHHVFDKLETDIREHAEAGEDAPDLILFTGDLAWSGQGKQYELVNGCLDRIRGWLRSAWPGCDPLLFAVPGNHDLTRPSGRRKRECLILKSEDADDRRELHKELWIDRNPELISELFEAYTAWHRERVLAPLEEAARRGARCRLVHGSFFPGDLSAVIAKDGFELGLVGLNSAWVQYTGGDFEGKLQLPIEQLHAALPASGGSPLDFFRNRRSLLLMHHPPGWLSPAARERFDQLVYDPERFDACLYGHMHASKAETRTVSGGPMRVFIQSPSLFGLEHYGTKNEDRAFGYAWGEIGAHDGLRIWPRRLVNRDAQVWQFDRDPGGYYRGRSKSWYWLREPRRTGNDAQDDGGGGDDEDDGPDDSAEPDHTAYLRTYADWARDSFEHVPMLGLAGDDLSLTMDEIWVPLRFEAQERHDLDAEHCVGRGLGEHGRVELGSAVGLAEQRGYRHMFVIGDPGMGKTMALKKLLWELLDEHAAIGFDGRALGLPAKTVPVFLRLRDLAGPPLERGDVGRMLHGALEAMMRPGSVSADNAESTAQVASSPLPEGFGHWLWTRGDLLLLLDGLDEIADDDERRKTCEHLEALAADGAARGVRVVASSRLSGIRGGIDLNQQQFLHLRVQPLDDDAVADLVRQWFAAAGQARARQRRDESGADTWHFDEAQGLLSELESQTSAKLKELASTPLLLTLMCVVVARGQQLPKRRVDFFAKCLDVLLESWLDAQRRTRLLHLHEALDMLELVAWYMHDKQRRYDLKKSELSDILAPRIRKIQAEGRQRAGVIFESVLRWLCKQAGALTEYSKDHYDFCHLHLREYLVAVHAGKRGKVGELADRFDQEFWREVMLLFVARSESVRDFRELMAKVLASEALVDPDEERRGRVQDLLYECLLEAYEVDVAPFVELARDPTASVARRQAALYAVRDQHDDQVLAVASAVAAEDPAVPDTLRLTAEQIETNAQRIRQPIELADGAADVLIVCASEDEPAARAMAERMRGWQWSAEVVTALRVADEPWRRARTVVAVAGPDGRGPWRDAETRRSLVELARWERPAGEDQSGHDALTPALVTALVAGAEAQALPSFLQRVPSSAVEADVAASSLPGALAELLGVTVPEASRSIEAFEPARVFVEPMTEMRFLWVPGGTFWMGSGDEDPEAYDDEKPKHQVQVSPFWLAETPVTNRQYEQFLQARPETREPRFWRNRQYNQAEQPVVGGSWLEAAAFCEWLAEVSGRRMVLPTEAQWEFAARGQDGRRYPWGNEPPDESRAHYGKSWRENAALPVGSRPAGRGPYGHLDLAGNVLEWCRDAWDEEVYTRRAAATLTIEPYAEPPDDKPLNEVQRACRGGAFYRVARGLRAACRYGHVALDWGLRLGFRVAALPASH
ncbi:SUMF1/EgtB/PvdO family nonheme iron enzyme [Haliangium sp.]|uniref:SUMF1/EgtB/PvdO family nonheme iron enzyme n=1 Tax=Haliangium sp. TaxID=2663208 RepID=UPI003D0F7798